MKLFLTAISLCFMLSSLMAQPGKKKPVRTTTKKAPVAKTVKVDPKVKDSASYALGQLIGNNLLTQYLQQANQNIGSINTVMFKKGLIDMLQTGKPRQSLETCNNKVMQYQALAKPSGANGGQANNSETITPEVAKNLAAGKAFLDSVAKTEGAMKTASGIVYKVITPATGAKPTAPTDRVTVFYNGTLINGEKFDGNFDAPEPITFALNGVIPGWTEGVQLMETGSTYRLFLPANLAYGNRGAGGKIGGGSTLIFDIKLIGINMPEPKPAPQPDTPTPAPPPPPKGQ